jgi:hypothetical protein
MFEFGCVLMARYLPAEVSATEITIHFPKHLLTLRSNNYLLIHQQLT